MRRRLVLAALFLLLLSWNAALFAAPTGDLPGLSALTYVTGSLICHQQPARSFYRGGAQLPVCARCLGLYGGALIGVAGWALLGGLGAMPRRGADRLLRPSFVRGALILTAIPTLVTVMMAWLGVWDATNLVRAVIAVPLGATVAVAVVAVGAGDLR